MTERVKAALARGEFSRARELLCAEEGAATPELLELRGQAAYGAGELEECLTAYEELHRLHVEGGRNEEAALAAVMVAMYLMMDTGLMATVRAWLGRAESLLGEVPDSSTFAWLSAIRTYERFMCGDMPGAGACARAAIDLGERHGIKPPIIIGRTALGRVLVHDGLIDDGLSLLDDVALELQTGQLDPMTSGQMWCELICAMQWVGQHDRAEEWTQAMERWRERAAFGGLNGRCRVHRAEILRMRGPCEEAEQEALRACEELRPWMRREFGWPLTELGNARLQKGDLAGAEEAYQAAHDNAWSPNPGLALLRLAQGRIDEAWSLIQGELSHPYDNPSKEFPPSGGLRRAPLLDAKIRIALATGRIGHAREAATELAAVAATYRSRTLANRVTAAHGRIALAEARFQEALPNLTAAMLEWMELRVPFEAATLRLEMAAAHRGSGNLDDAERERSAACRMFETLGAHRWIDISQCEPTALKSAPSPKKEEEQVAMFRRSGDIRTLRFAETEVQLKDLKGMRYIERLLSDPGREFHALDLVDVERGALPTASAHTDEPEKLGEPGMEVFDTTAREAYRRRLQEIEEDIEEATQNNDFERARLAREDREFLVRELARGVGLGGRSRKVGEGSERARTAATRSVRYAVDRVAAHHPLLGEHLRCSIRTGTYFSYEPDPLSPLRWIT